MNKKTIYAFYTFVVLFLVLCFVTAYIFNVRSMNSNLKEKKMAFVEIVKLPDLAISTGATFVRHRSLATVFSIYKDDGNLREYFPSTYAISHSHIINKRKQNEK